MTSLVLVETSEMTNDGQTDIVELTVVMPCLDEAETIEICIRKARVYFDGSGTVGEIVIADNGSTDGSQDIAKSLGARVVHVSEKGYGAALMGGIVAAQGRYVIMGDADDSYNFEKLDLYLEALRAGNQLVMGNRFKGGIEPGAMPLLHRFLGNPVLSFLGRLFYGTPIGDFHCGLRGFSREAILTLGLKSPGMEFASEMVVKASLNNLKIAEVPTTLSPSGRTRAPHLRTWPDGWKHLRFLLLHSPRWLFFYPGLFMMLGGLIAAALVSRGQINITPSIQLGVHTLLVACFSVVAGFQMILFSALARRHSIAEGYLPAPANSELFLRLTLERILQIAGLLFASGVGGVLWAVYYWASLGFGPILYSLVLNVLVISLSTATVSIQLASAGFLASVFDIRR